jgi:TonB family protein
VGIIATVLQIGWAAVFVSCAASVCVAQGQSTDLPSRVVIASDTFFDFGPPFNYYELIIAKSSPDGLSVERVEITPPGMACVQPAKVESRTVTVSKTMEELLQGKNPCAIPEKDLDRELKRRKKGLVFSGVNVAMQVQCGAAERMIRMDILDRDLFAATPNTPEHTSWTMGVLRQVNEEFGSDVMDKPAFATGDEALPVKAPDSGTIRSLRDGTYDALFGKNAVISELVRESELPPPPSASVELESSKPFSPISPQMPDYPPIARAAKVEGSIQVDFDLDSSGKVQNVTVDSEPRAKLLQSTTAAAVSNWTFPEAAFGHKVQVTLLFQLNCHASSSERVH